MENRPTAIEMEEVTDAKELTQGRRQREQFDRNSAWLQAHISEIYAKHRFLLTFREPRRFQLILVNSS